MIIIGYLPTVPVELPAGQTLPEALEGYPQEGNR